MFASKRLGKELQKINRGLPPGIDLVKADDLRQWHMDIRVLDSNPIYKDQIFRLQFVFSNQYPIEAPEVTFVYLRDPPLDEPATTARPPPTEPLASSDSRATFRPIPIHPHIYSNGFICLDLLGSQGWSPVQSVESVCMSLQSMLTGNTKNEKPPGDEEFVRQNAIAGKRPKDIGWWYHNDGV